MKKINISSFSMAFIALVTTTFSCVEEEMRMPCFTNISQAGEILEDCFHYQEINHEFYPFRSSTTVDIDLENDGEVDLIFLIEDTSFGIAGPGSGDTQLIPMVDGVEIGRLFVESMVCNRYLIFTEPGQDPLVAWQDRNLCTRYTEEELNEVDSIYRVDYSDYMVRPFNEGEEISDQIEWHNDSLSLSRPSYLVGEFEFEVPAYALIRKIEDGIIRYGWIKVRFDGGGYSVLGELISTGMVLN